MNDDYERGYQDGQMDAEATPTATMFEGCKVSVGISRDGYAAEAKACVNIELPVGSDLHAFFESIAYKRSGANGTHMHAPDVPPNAMKITTGQAGILITKNGGKPIVASNGQNIMTVLGKTYVWGKKHA